MTAAAAALPAVAGGPTRWEPVTTRAPRLAATMLTYLDQLAVSQRPATVQSTDTALRLFASFVIDHDPKVRSVRQVQRRHIEAYKTTLTTPREHGGRSLKNNTVRMRLGMLRLFFERIIEWGWDDAPARCPVFEADLPKVDDPLPKFLDDPSAARFMRAAAELDPRRRLVVEMLARTGMRVSELCELRSDAVMIIGDAHWLRIPVGKLHHDRLIPLHPSLVDLLSAWRTSVGPDDSGLLLTNQGRPLNRYSVNRIIKRVGQRAGIDGMHAHRLRHTLATQAINRGMSLEAIAALLGHRSMRMTLIYARIADRTVADEYYAVTEQVEALYSTTPVLPASAEGRQMRQLRVETHRRLLGNGYCTRPPELDCVFESICETCTHYHTGLEFQPVLLRQRDHALEHDQTERAELFNKLLDGIDDS
jgi:site-specific recombinase XerD